MPRADIERVIPLVVDDRTKVRKIPSRTRRMPVVVPKTWLGARLVPAPRRVVAGVELGGCAIRVHVITQRDHRTNRVNI